MVLVWGKKKRTLGVLDVFDDILPGNISVPVVIRTKHGVQTIGECMTFGSIAGSDYYVYATPSIEVRNNGFM